jgi:hypothetical protein
MVDYTLKPKDAEYNKFTTILVYPGIFMKTDTFFQCSFFYVYGINKYNY